MQFFKQQIQGSCNIIALQHVLSFYNRKLSFQEIKCSLPKHAFGSWVFELGIFLADLGIQTKLISNSSDFKTQNKDFSKGLESYKKIGSFEDRIPTVEDINKNPIIINVDSYKIRSVSGGLSAHYVVALKEDNGFYLYDGDSFDQKIPYSFENLLESSKNINRFGENGMWLFMN